MSDNISRQAAMAYPLSWEHYDKEHGDRKFICGVESYREYIEQLPSTDRNGEWLEAPCKEYDKFVLCSECRKFGGSGELAEVVKNYNFCPHCGADMRGGKHE